MASSSSPLSPTAQEEEQIQWTIESLIDEVYLSLINVKAAFCMIGGTKTEKILDPNNEGRDVLRRLYEEQARYKMYRIPVFQPAPFFVIYLRDLDDRIKQELADLNQTTLDYVLKEAICRIFAHIDERYFLLNVRRLLKWKLEE